MAGGHSEISRIRGLECLGARAPNPWGHDVSCPCASGPNQALILDSIFASWFVWNLNPRP
jgi:hypothetical protein